MDLQRWLHLVNFDERLLRLFQKLQSDGAPADLGLEASVLEDRRRWQTAAVSGVQRSQGHGCIFNFFQGPLCKLSEGTAVLCILPEYTCTCTRLYMVFLWLMQVRLIKKNDVHVCYHSGS